MLGTECVRVFIYLVCLDLACDVCLGFWWVLGFGVVGCFGLGCFWVLDFGIQVC